MVEFLKKLGRSAYMVLRKARSDDVANDIIKRSKNARDLVFTLGPYLLARGFDWLGKHYLGVESAEDADPVEATDQ